MPEIKKPIAWLNSKNEVQMEWAWRYFSSRRVDLPLRGPTSAYQAQLMNWLKDLANSEETSALLKSARNAWRQKECRQKNDRKAYNFLLLRTAHANLKGLAQLRKTTMTAVLEELIRDALAAEKRHKSDLKNLREKHQQSLGDLNDLNTDLRRVIKDFSDTAKELGKEVSILLEERCKAGIGVSEPLTEDDQIALTELHREELSKLKARIPQADRLLVFSPRPYMYKQKRARSEG